MNCRLPFYNISTKNTSFFPVFVITTAIQFLYSSLITLVDNIFHLVHKQLQTPLDQFP